MRERPGRAGLALDGLLVHHAAQRLRWQPASRVLHLVHVNLVVADPEAAARFCIEFRAPDGYACEVYRERAWPFALEADGPR